MQCTKLKRSFSSEVLLTKNQEGQLTRYSCKHFGCEVFQNHSFSLIMSVTVFMVM